MTEYNPKEIESKWHKTWLDENIFAAADTSDKEKKYVLDMFPYPSGDGLHVGHVKIYTSSDVASRYYRMRGFNVLHPSGWDAFGLPAENSAIKFGVHPSELTKKNIKNFRKQMQDIGLSYDWNREINTTDPEYFKWTQWIFLQMFKRGLAYEDTIPINWCPSCKTGLANEEVVKEECERCGSKVEQKPMRQWMLRITAYADKLLSGLDQLDWPSSIKDLQQNWIGRSEGAEIKFLVDGKKDEYLEVFTTRPDTIMGVSALVLSPDHPMLNEIVNEIVLDDNKEAVDKYIKEAAAKTSSYDDEDKEKTGVFTGSYAINPVNQARVPIWVGDYVTMTYGTGAIMVVPAHDERDYEFAKKYSLPIKQVIDSSGEKTELPYTGKGVLVNSGEFDGQASEEAGANILAFLQLKDLAQAKVNYKLRDWVFSRQRYWGEPIPLIHCKECGVVPVPEEDLPVELPPLKSYEPTGTGESPLADVPEWVNVKCPTCDGQAKRETNTMPQWAGSSWYWLRYLDVDNKESIAKADKIKEWMPVDLYIGGAEHAVLHLLYARFWHKVLFDIGIVFTEEPFQKFRSVGLVMGSDGQKMSKSKGNVVNPDDVIKEYGADTLRVYAMFMGPFDQAVAWNPDSIKGVNRFLTRFWNMVNNFAGNSGMSDGPEVELTLHRTVKRVTESTEQFKFNTAISALMEMLNLLEKQPGVSKSTLDLFVLMLAPYAPHMAEELWSLLGHTESLTYQAWPEYDADILATANIDLPVQINGKVRGTIPVSPDIDQEEAEKEAKNIQNVNKYLIQGTVVKVIYIPGKTLNFVVK